MNTEPDRRPARLLLALLVLIAAARTAHYYPLLPATLASHSNGRGEPNGWSSKQAFLEIYWGLFLLTLLLPYWATKLIVPVSLGNGPNREYCERASDAKKRSTLSAAEWGGLPARLWPS